ncbi:membrane protein insertase YidC [Zhengella mangrovi]|uniref:Membrane protein insertase YidC n=1 Tax=Zhengella mangrovi TaxID=1982044 RepID=A0A2G1QH18_9HYPH|nr:membrane protein insertase YidC [Zhengella mangrovi]PHP64813.1 membrane protein insertase YidC [Zhengella mangrovi]
MENNRNFFLTIAISVVILTLWQVFYMNPRIEAQREAARIQTEEQASKQPAQTGQAPATQPKPAADGTAAPQPAGQAATGADVPGGTAAPASDAAVRVAIDTPSLSGSINTVGARLDELVLKDYRVSVDKNSANIQLLHPSSDDNGYFAELGYAGSDATGAVPGPDTVWTVEGDAKLTPQTPVTLTFTNDKGLTFKRTFSVDDEYMFTVSDTIANASGADVALPAYGRVTRFNKPDTHSTYVLHEGLIGVTGDEGLQEIKYSKIEDEKRVVPGKSSNGWLGITDKYWAVTMIPQAGETFQPRFAYFDDGRSRYQADFLTDAVAVPAGGSTTLKTQIFAGAKEVNVINAYKDKDNIREFDLMIDWGWFYFITKPMFWLMDHLFKLLGNFGLAILATTVIVKLIFFPLANKSYTSMAKMKQVQPKMTEIREKYADDKMRQQQEMMELYKTEKINPIAGCWPVLLQIPVFFSLYKVLYVTIEMRHAPFYGWIHDLSAPDPTSVFNLFGLLPYDVPSFLMIGVWPLIMGITMFLQMRMNPTPPDPTQAMIFTWMPVMFTFMMAAFPAGLIIYWAWNNTLSIIQQAVIMKRQGTKIELWDNVKGLINRRKPAE